MEKPKAPRGAPDLVPPESELLTELEDAARMLFDRYGYRRIETPVFEHTEIFERSAGEASDIVLEKQMYTFIDRGDRSLTLRPEGTAGVVRAYVEHDLGKKLGTPVRLFYSTWFFRYERPQKARTRQFHQIGAEAIGSESPVIDAELIVLAQQFFEGVGLAPELLLNSMGCIEDRKRYAPALKEALAAKIDDMCDECHVRLQKNPLRVFDCKVAGCRRILRGGDIPPIAEYLCEDCKTHHKGVQDILEVLGVAWKEAPYLVRGLDYYTRTVFELEASELSARATVCAGGRYDGLVEQLGGSPTPACGFAIGTTATMAALGANASIPTWHPDVHVAWLDGLSAIALALATDLRRAGLRVTMSDDSKPLRPQLRAADKLGATRVVILGPDEIAAKVATVREMGDGTERKIALDDLVSELAS
jgi:histidyl-tRNA synthetase